MTLDELVAREAIRDTLAAYNLAGDRMRHADFLDCFTEDALYRSSVFSLAGRTAIRAWLEGFRAGAADVRLVRHHLTTSRIAIENADEARARSYYLVVTERGPDHGGVYVDRFRRVGARWLIAEREVRLDWARPDTWFVTPGAVTELAAGRG
jgi:3-phenylpropionate/cinnamic acid dioxygenase small subunit